MASRVLNKFLGGKSIIWKVALSLLVAVAFMVIGSFKSGYHFDEIYTMGLSNHQYNGTLLPEINDGVSYTGQQLWQEYTMVDENNRFDYKNVFENQINDTHPPLYYMLIHTVFSLFPNTYNIYYLLIVNIILAIIILWQMIWLFRFFTKKEGLSVIFSLLFIFTMGFVNSVMYFRMYVLLAVWTNALIILFCKYKPADKGWKYYLSLILIFVGGMMTQYYFIIFAAFACLIYAIRVVMEKNWKKIILSSASIVVSIGVSTAIFPTMWTHIFSGGRGEEAFSNLSADGLLDSVKTYFDKINLELFGNLFTFLFFFAVVLFIVASKNIEKGINKENKKEIIFNYLQLAIPIICYIVLVAQISPYKTDRYIMNIMGILYVLVFAILIQLANSFSKYAVAGIVSIAFLVLLSSYKEGINYLYTVEETRTNKIESLGEDVACIYIYDSIGYIFPNYVEMENLNNIVFINSNNLELLNENTYKNYDKLIIYIQPSDNSEEIINQLIEQNPDLDSYKKLFTSWFATAYYLE